MTKRIHLFAVTTLVLAGCAYGAADEVGGSGSLEVSEEQHLMMGVPVDATPDDDYLLKRSGMVISYNRYLNEPNWVSYRLQGADYGDAPRFSGQFIKDDSLPAGWYRGTHKDYTCTIYDRGHMVRSEERTIDDAANKQTFILSNVLPQTGAMNRGPWLAFERFAEHQARAGKTLYIVAGGIYSAACNTHAPRTAGDGCLDIGRNTDPQKRLAVPDSTFKIIAIYDTQQDDSSSLGRPVEVVAVIMPNAEDVRNDPWTRYLTTVDEIERLTGYDFLTALPANVQAELESVRSTCAECRTAAEPPGDDTPEACDLVPVTVEMSTPIAIPDRDPNGITSRLDMPADMTVPVSARVQVDITHSYNGDLEVLIRHAGVEIPLIAQSNVRGENIHQLIQVPALVGVEPAGGYELIVRDLVSVDTGTLDHWSLTLTP